MKCFYHNDADGKCAGFWVSLSAGVQDIELYGDMPQMIPIDYRLPFPIETIRPGEQVYIVDFSIEPDMMKKLLLVTKDVTWIDHHKTAIDKYADFGESIRGVRHDGVAGCMLTYCYLHHMTERGSGDIKPFELSMTEDAPMFTKLVADWDTFTFKYGDDSRHFHLAFNAYDFSPDSKQWAIFWTNQNFHVDLIKEGQAIQRFVNEWAKSYMELGFATNFEGHKCFAANLGRCNSDYFKSVDNQYYEILIPFVFDGSQYTVSLYSKSIDVGDIAKRYGGGGHKGAAGFQCKELPFTREG